MSAFTAYIVFLEKFDYSWVLPILGVFFLAFSAACLNQIQEIKFDSLMERTNNRPLVTKELTINQAIICVLISGFTGLAIIFFSSGILPFFLGLTSIIIYNGVYTFAKRLTAFGSFPGALIGALPPLIGWTAAGGSLTDFRAWILAFFFFMGQIPHFWLLLTKYNEQYHKAGFPTLTKLLSLTQINRMIFIWVVCTVASSFLFIQFSIIETGWMVGIQLLISFGVLIKATQLLKTTSNKKNNKQLFIWLNFYYLIMMIVLIVNSLI